MSQKIDWVNQIQVDKSSIQPLYLQVKEALESWIVSSTNNGTLSSGDRLPSENELSAALGISSITIKHALNELRRQGLIQRIQGRGSFIVEQNKIVLDLKRLFSITNLTKERGMRPLRVTLEMGEVRAAPSIARRLALSPQDMVIKLVRLRLMDRTPVNLDTSYLPARLFPDLTSVYQDQFSLYDTLEEHYQIEVFRAHDVLSPVLINRLEAKELEIPIGTLGILVERVSYSKENQPLEFTKSVFRGDLCNFSFEYTKEKNGTESPA